MRECERVFESERERQRQRGGRRQDNASFIYQYINVNFDYVCCIRNDL